MYTYMQSYVALSVLDIQCTYVLRADLYSMCVFICIRTCTCTQNELIPDDHQSSVVEHVVHVHLSVGQFSKEFQQKLRRSNHVTPKNYLDFISSYTKLLKEKDKYICDQCSRLSGGLTKLNEASEQIKVLNNQLEVQKVAVTEKSTACEALLTDISSKQEIGTQKKQEAEKKSEEMEEQNKVRVVQHTRLDTYTCMHS